MPRASPSALMPGRVAGQSVAAAGTGVTRLRLARPGSGRRPATGSSAYEDMRRPLRLAHPIHLASTNGD
ncbi:hypothetical protein SANTM175S_00776 [Streptomyces antimycoticus]